MNNTKEHNWVVKANRSPRSLKLAIYAYCFYCMGGTLEQMPDFGWKDDIRDCTAPYCPLFLHRPYQLKRPALATLQKNIGEEGRGADDNSYHNDEKNLPANNYTGVFDTLPW